MIDNLRVLKKRLDEACKVRGTLLIDLCRGMNVAPNAAHRLALNPERLSVEQLIEIARKLDVSIDWLAGFTNNPDSHKAAPSLPGATPLDV
jgi:transcriptional regulator with XRE-family HTH domain